MDTAKMTVSSGWVKAAVVTFVLGFAVLGYLAARIISGSPPIPREVRVAGGQVLFTGDDIMAGQHIFQKFGLMQYGTIFGHGAYLGPDFTAEALHRGAKSMLGYYLGQGVSGGEARAQGGAGTEGEPLRCRDGGSRLQPGSGEAFSTWYDYYRDWFGPGNQRGLRRPAINDPA